MKSLRRLAVALMLPFFLVSCAMMPIAPAFENPETAELLASAQQFIDNRTGVFVQDAPLPVNDSFSQGLIEAEVEHIATLRDLRQRVDHYGVEYSHALTELTLDSRQDEGAQIVLVVNDYTRMYYVESMDGGTPEFEAWSVKREFVFELYGADWALSSQRLLGKGVPPMIDQAAE